MRLVTYNVEWFSALFDRQDELICDSGWSRRHGVSRALQIEALGIVFSALDADAVMVVEAPDTGRRQSTIRALQNFARRFNLRARSAVIGFANETQQEIALLFDPDALRARHDPIGAPTGKAGSPNAPRFDGTFRIDLDVDARRDSVRFSKPPLEMEVTTAAGTHLRIIGAHLKSKAAHGAGGRDAKMRQSIANRRKQLAQAIWLRRRIAGHLDEGTPLIVMGDLNDGPGLDDYEHLFGRSSVEILLGDELFDPHARPASQHRAGARPSTARFQLPGQGRFLDALLDYVMISPDLMARAPAWRIWHPFDDPDCRQNAELRQALLDASDHFPVSLDIEI